MGCVQELDREAGKLSHGASEETTGTYKGGAEVRGRAGQSTQEGTELDSKGNYSNWEDQSSYCLMFLDTISYMKI